MVRIILGVALLTTAVFGADLRGTRRWTCCQGAAQRHILHHDAERRRHFFGALRQFAQRRQESLHRPHHARQREIHQNHSA